MVKTYSPWSSIILSLGGLVPRWGCNWPRGKLIPLNLRLPNKFRPKLIKIIIYTFLRYFFVSVIVCCITWLDTDVQVKKVIQHFNLNHGKGPRCLCTHMVQLLGKGLNCTIGFIHCSFTFFGTIPCMCF